MCASAVPVPSGCRYPLRENPRGDTAPRFEGGRTIRVVLPAALTAALLLCCPVEALQGRLTAPAEGAASGWTVTDLPRPVADGLAAPPGCHADPTTFCMSYSRVTVGVTWVNPYSGAGGTAGVLPQNDEFAYFYFSEPKNPEVFVKVLGDNNPDWIQLFVGGATDFEYTVTFTGCSKVVTFHKPPFQFVGTVSNSQIPNPSCARGALYTAAVPVTSINGLTGDVTLTAGTGVAISSSGSSLTIASTASGGGGSLSLPYSGSASTAANSDAFHVTNTGAGRAIQATAQSDTALWGVSTSGPGVVGWSTSADGVEGKTSGAEKSGVWGHSTAGFGVTGMSTQRDGVVGTTSSTAPGAAGVRASNSGGGPALYSDGDIYATGAFRGNLGPGGGAPFPRPAWDSGWVGIGKDESVILQHNLGGDTDNYVVDMQFRNYYSTNGPFLDSTSTEYHGANWWYLTDSSIMILRGLHDEWAEKIRIRIWVYR